MRLAQWTGLLAGAVFLAGVGTASAVPGSGLSSAAQAVDVEGRPLVQLVQGGRDPADRIGQYDRQGATRIAPHGTFPQRYGARRYYEDDFAEDRDRDRFARSPRWNRWCARNSWHPDCDAFVWNERGWLGRDYQTRMGSGRIIPHAGR